MPGSDEVRAIIGLPDILKSFLRVFVGMLEDASEMLQEGHFNLEQDITLETHVIRSAALLRILTSSGVCF